MKILAYGFYGKGNIGDDLFQSAFRKLFPKYTFTFTDVITNDMLNVDAVFFGGGSFLEAAPQIDRSALEKLNSLPIFYISIGREAQVHPIHNIYLRKAKLIAARAIDTIKKLESINPNTIYIPDIVYSLQSNFIRQKKEKTILILPNCSTIPTWKDEQWKYLNYERFKFEYAQFLDWVIDNGYNIRFGSMENSCIRNDVNAAIDIMNRMCHKNCDLMSFSGLNLPYLLELFSKHEMVISQRYHGNILSELARTKYISIFHHDKLKRTHLNEGVFVSMYEQSKYSLQEKFDFVNQHMKLDEKLPIVQNSFEELINKVSSLLETNAEIRRG